MTPLARALALSLVLAVATACTRTDDPEAAPPPPPPTTAPPATAPTTTAAPSPAGPDVSQARFRLTRLEEVEVVQPTAVAVRSGSANLYVAERGGQVWEVEVEVDDDDGSVELDQGSRPVLDLTDRLTAEGGEQGLLGLAFSTDGRRLYASYTRVGDGANVVDEYLVEERSRTTVRIDEESRRELLVVEQPFSNHNGGHVVTGPDGFLWVGLGDGGGRGDPEANAQDRSTLLGSILRIDPQSPTPEAPYSTPLDNPFVGEGGVRGEIWAWGLRNPWRFSFDAETGDLWVADVGQDQWEEVNLLTAEGGLGRGANLGWPELEGTRPFEGGRAPEGAVAPIFEYPHEGGACSVTGGHVYRGEAIPSLQGVYVFGDYCSGELRGLTAEGGRLTGERTFEERVPNLVSFFADSRGELHAVSATEGIFRLDPA